MTINEDKDKRISVHTWKKYVPEIMEISKKNGWKPSKPCEKLVKSKYGSYKKFGLCQYEDLTQECFPDVYTVVYFHQHQNIGELGRIFTVFKHLALEDNPDAWMSNKSIHYKYNLQHIKKIKVNYHLPSVKIQNKYPIYVLSLGRYSDLSFPDATCMTLEEMGLEYTLVLMTREVENYRETLKRYNCKYCVNIIHLEDNHGLGGTPQRNLAWDDSKKRGFSKHWILDDNIHGYFWFNRRQKIQIKSGVVFRNVEDFVDNLNEKVGLAAHAYRYDTRGTEMRNPIIVNGKTFSSILVNHNLLDKCKIKWRLKYNEDIDLGLQVLSNGFMTIGYETFLSGKKATKDNREGGNRDIYLQYKQEGFVRKLECLQNEWGHIPNLIGETTKKLGKEDERVHHLIDWDRFKPKTLTNKKKEVHTILTPKKKHQDWMWYGIKEEIIS